MKANKKKIKIGIIGGSGIDDPKIFKNAKEIISKTPYGKPASKLITGKIGNQEVVVLARHGKDHSIMPTNVPYQANIWALKQAGCSHILATAACGSLRQEIKPKQLIFLDQFIDFTKHRNLTLYNDSVVHTAMADPFCLNLRELLAKTAKDLKIAYHKRGTIVVVEGPRFSTRAESHMFRKLGADAIGMTTVPEAILAREAGICYASIAMATDYDSWHKSKNPVTWGMVLSAMKENSKNAKKILLEIIPRIDFLECSCS